MQCRRMINKIEECVELARRWVSQRIVHVVRGVIMCRSAKDNNVLRCKFSRCVVCVCRGERVASPFSVNPPCRIDPGILLIWERS